MYDYDCVYERWVGVVREIYKPICSKVPHIQPHRPSDCIYGSRPGECVEMFVRVCVKVGCMCEGIKLPTCGKVPH